MSDEAAIIEAFRQSGYSYPGTAAGAVTLLVGQLARLQDEAERARMEYATLLRDVRQAVDAAPHFGDGRERGDPIREVARLAEHLASLKADKSGHAAVSDALLHLREVFPEQSAANAESAPFLEAVGESMTEGDAATVRRVVETSVAYWRALKSVEPEPALMLAAMQWNQAVDAHLDPEP